MATILQGGRRLFSMLPSGTGQVDLSNTNLPDTDPADALGFLVRAFSKVADGAGVVFSQWNKSGRVPSVPSDEGYAASVRTDGTAQSSAKAKLVRLSNDPSWWNTSLRSPTNGGINMAWRID